MPFPLFTSKYKWVSKFQNFLSNKDLFSLSSFFFFAILSFFQWRCSKTFRGIEWKNPKTKPKKIAQILMLLYFILRQKRTKEKVVVKKKTLSHLVHLLLGLQDNSSWKLARLYSKLCGFIIYLSKVYLLYLLCKPHAICMAGAGKENLSAAHQTYNKGMT